MTSFFDTLTALFVLATLMAWTSTEVRAFINAIEYANKNPNAVDIVGSKWKLIEMRHAFGSVACHAKFAAASGQKPKFFTEGASIIFLFTLAALSGAHGLYGAQVNAGEAVFYSLAAGIAYFYARHGKALFNYRAFVRACDAKALAQA